MSEALVPVGQQALATGGLGLGNSRLFKLKPAILELVSKTTRQDNVQPGKFRNISTNEHFDEMKVVLLFEPQEQRELYERGTNNFSKDAKLCFSLDNVQPHERAKKPGALYCATCPFGDINWEKWRKTHKPEDLPPCRKYWHLVIADRRTQMPYYFNVKGTSVTPFEQAMQNVARLLNMMQMNAKAENRAILATNAALTPEEKAAGKEKPLVPMPNLFDISFTMYPTQTEKGGPFVVAFKEFGAVKQEDRQAFGLLYMDFVNSRRSVPTQAELEAEAEEAQKNAAVTQPAPVSEAPAFVSPIPTGAVVGEVLPPEAKSNITI